LSCYFRGYNVTDAQLDYIMYRLKTWNQSEGRVRLSEDDGPPSTEFLEDDYDQDNEGLELDDEDDGPLTERVRMPGGASRGGESEELRPLRPLR